MNQEPAKQSTIQTLHISIVYILIPVSATKEDVLVRATKNLKRNKQILCQIWTLSCRRCKPSNQDKNQYEAVTQVLTEEILRGKNGNILLRIKKSHASEGYSHFL